MCLWCKPGKFPEETTHVTHMVTDQGNGGPHCGTCGHTEDFGRWGLRCPNCDRQIVSVDWYLNVGGSDF